MDRLITIPISHYCERARWALDYAGIEYREEQHLQLLHWPHTLVAGRGKTAPVLVTEQGSLADSKDVVRYADSHSKNGNRLYPDDPDEHAEVIMLEAEYEGMFGVESRRIMYGHAFRWGRAGLRFNAASAPRWERWMLNAGFPFVRGFMRWYLDVNQETESEAKARVSRVFDATANRLSDGRRYLVGSGFTAADLTFACMAAAVVCPPEYGVELPQPEHVPEDFARDIDRFRRHPAGAFALRIFREHRKAPIRTVR